MTGFDHHHHPHHPLSMLPNGLHIQTSLGPHHNGGTMRGSDIGGPTSFYNAIASEEDYLSALQQSAGTTLLTTATGQLAALNSQSNDVLSNSPYGNLADLHHHHHQAYMVATSGAGDVLTANGGMSNGGLVPPLPPLRSLMPGGGNSNGAAGGGGGSMSTFLPAISEEPAVTPIGHLV
ncbi:hypothetical protein TYRP_023698 [Tyrophagus putrescentiae]|nr:hypothetical protein TYRP_023698 [Tyrophagus putrescentiae]